MNTAKIINIDYEGRGVARLDGKTVFIHNALPLETAEIQITKDKGSFAEAEATQILQASEYRREPSCPHYGKCGGCALQHLEFSAQVAMKQRIFEEQLQRIGKVQPENLLPPIYGAKWHYRSRTRLSIFVDKQGRVNIGYQAKRSKRIVPISQCAVLPEHVSGSLKTIRDGLQQIHEAAPKVRLESVEISVGDEITVLNIIADKSLPENVLAQFSGSLKMGNWQIWQQIGKRAAQAVAPKNAPELSYRLPEFGLRMPFRVGDFTQINLPMNEVMVSRALRLLQPQAHERIADLFCGLGNFTLPIARSGAQVVGIEGADFLTKRAMNNAKANGLANIEFSTADLFDTTPQTIERLGYFDKMLLDPPRAGAYAVVQALHAPFLPKRIVYVSCNPATFARDATVLVEKGYRFREAGVMNLFPHTAHIEAVAVFDLEA
ncbi:23S rRNA (uracil(1939)-C(5))-methyltransferase RlmD [Kingella negevensis]|uniref:23S rRNA (uracil(1939)-C(5))-methyltransferase RlmD n=1 Tax=Kingella negevensis TaxID=1522312 RepID=A0A238T8Z8_9NEIS|nr:23S rRNA (uracil(1939)-C(5))-methyltransferase RlmD [Kingella negevensis]MDK4683810.1 23S rRNA (uracil(1939)-C(5))-methyltransferase RlmD [Kingella negevensis]MDK4708310.1 23S rRNA (uracil(1939)-C(5))-methyltransferase RlmD [Kingella negevensis]MDK4709146.1 23S rRNA (uracil(1939)-C(5))-methyltransferase RlmD [Kingella negevensis]SNB51206.1 23S rRNA (uracil(1939)-C(5))-methyltransferase RlmD [Kingella negevensis]